MYNHFIRYNMRVRLGEVTKEGRENKTQDILERSFLHYLLSPQNTAQWQLFRHDRDCYLVPCLKSGSCFPSLRRGDDTKPLENIKRSPVVFCLLLSLVCKFTSGVVASVGNKPCESMILVHEMLPAPFPDRLDTINGWERWAAHDHWANIRLDRASLTRRCRTPDTKNCKNFIHNGNHILFVTQIYLPTFWGLGENFQS